MFNITKKTETKPNIFGTKKPEQKKSSCGLSSSFKKDIMKSFHEDTKKMTRQERCNREAACQNVFGMSSEKFMKTMLK